MDVDWLQVRRLNVRRTVGFVIAIVGGAVSQVLTDEWNLDGLAAYGLLMAAVALVVLIAVPLSEGFGPRGRPGAKRARDRAVDA